MGIYLYFPLLYKKELQLQRLANPFQIVVVSIVAVIAAIVVVVVVVLTAIRGAASSSASLLGSALVSERHAYKYRCSQCSLAFKTAEKLALHSQYHVIRDATRCRLCSRDD